MTDFLCSLPRGSTRRAFLRHTLMATGCVAAASMVGTDSSALGAMTPLRRSLDNVDDEPFTSDPRIKPLLQQTIDAAIAAGASYSDVRLTHTRKRFLGAVRFDVNGNRGAPSDVEEISIGVRALVQGYWGFASGPIWTLAEGARLGHEATRQAKVNTLGKSRPMALAPTEVVKDGAWTMPVAIDPFTIHPSQLQDILMGVAAYARTTRSEVQGATLKAIFIRQDRAVATSDGTYFTQRTYETSGSFLLSVARATLTADFLGAQGVGFELMDEDRLRAAIDPLLEEYKWNQSLPSLPLDVGRYEAVLGAPLMQGFVATTLGVATELDRALGYEANAGGSSYLNDPAAMVGAYVLSSPHLSVTGERSMPGGVATVQWDDEGVIPTPTPLVTKGVLTNYQTTREGAAWLAAEKPGMVARSAGCAYSPVGVDAPLPHTANLVMHPGPESLTFDDLVKSVKKGIAIKAGTVSVDYQQLNGLAGGGLYEIVNGKIVGRLIGGAIMFRAPEFWKGIRAIGGDGSERTGPATANKGEPPQRHTFTVQAVPAHHEGLTFVDPKRKA